MPINLGYILCITFIYTVKGGGEENMGDFQLLNKINGFLYILFIDEISTFFDIIVNVRKCFRWVVLK